MTGELISYFITNGILCLAQCLFSFFLLEPRWKRLPVFLLFYVPFTFAAVSQKIFTQINPTFLVVVANIIFIVASLTLFKDKIGYKMMVMLFNFLINIAWCGMIYALFMEICSAESGEVPSAYRHAMICTVIVADFVVALIIKNKKREVNIDGKGVAVFMCITVAQLITYLILCVILNSEDIFEKGKRFSVVGSSRVDMRYLLYILIVIFIVADVLVYYLLRKSFLNRLTEEQLAYAQYRNDINYEYYRNLEQNQTETRKIYHDMNNIIQVCKSLSGDESTKESALAILNDVESRLSQAKTVNYCANSLANAVLTSKVKLCNENNITVEVAANLPDSLNISDTDLCRALVNLFDNAIEAAQRSDNPLVKLSAGTEGDTLFIGTENPVPTKEKSSVKNNKYHGLGLKIIKEVAQKYNGELTSMTENGNVRKVLMLKIPFFG